MVRGYGAGRMRCLSYLAALLALAMPRIAAAASAPSTADLFDISQGTTIIANSPILARSGGADIRDMFGGRFTVIPVEVGNALFDDGFPAGTVHFVEWRTASPITLRGLRLFAKHDDPPRDARWRGFSLFVLYAKRSGSDVFERIFEFTPANPYGGGAEGNMLALTANIDPVEAQEFRVEFVQYGDISPTASGPRIIELDGFATPLSDRNPIVLVPALLTSFNYQALLRDREGGTWRFVPLFGNLYQGLIERLEGAGFEEGKDLIVAHYDWRQPITESATEYLMPAIDAVQASSGVGPDGKVDVITHSMGGLVARQYIQSAQYRNDIDKLMLIGAPNEGAADVYVAWEGGEFPERWGVLSTTFVSLIEKALKHEQNLDLESPLSFRALFPALQDLLPIQDFVTRDGITVARSELVEQNPLLQRLKDDLGILTDRVQVQAIIGDQLKTLERVPLTSGRTPEDKALERWRDGHPNPDPPQTDTTAGDQTVPVSSASLGSDPLVLPNVVHVKLPEEAQEEALELLGLDASGPHLAYDQPASVLGVLVLSPVDPSLTCGGYTLSKEANTFPDAEYITDTSDPQAPKLLVVGNPPEGKCAINLRAAGDGPFTVVTTFADADDTIITARKGEAVAGQQEQTTVIVTSDSFQPSVRDLLALIKKVRDTIVRLKREGHIKGPAHGRLLAVVSQSVEPALAHGHSGQRVLYERLKALVARFSHELQRHIERGNLDDVAIRELVALQQELKNAGL